VIKQFGVSTTGSWGAFDLATIANFPIAPQTLAKDNILSGTARSGNFSATARLESYERAGVSRVLASRRWSRSPASPRPSPLEASSRFPKARNATTMWAAASASAASPSSTSPSA
jgi:hypothetical protein